jgi:tripartite-type tricarboxylate transporter receptor subunit TctC
MPRADTHSVQRIGLGFSCQHDSIVARLNAEINEAVRADDVHEKLRSIGFDTMEQRPLEAADFFKSELVKWDKIVRAIGFSVD